MKIIKTKLPQVLIIEPQVHKDSRGFFMEMYREDPYREAGVTLPFVQDNVSASGNQVLRGLHYQLKRPQGKLLSVLRGKMRDVIVDLRRNSPQFGEWMSVELSADNNRQVYIPPGMAHGYCTLSDEVLVHYKCTAYYDPQDEYAVLWSDPEIGVDWSLTGEPLVSAKDAAAPLLKDIPREKLPQ